MCNQLVQVLQRSAGQAESGHYFLAGGCYATNATISCYIASLSRVSTPVSVTIDTADLAPTGGIGGVSTGNLTVGGFQVYSANTTSAQLNPRAGGNYTDQF